MAGATTTRDGLALSALDVAYSADGQDFTVTVSLLYGSPHQRQIEVATVKITTAQTVIVDQLKAFGVEPIALSIVVLPPSALYPPALTCASRLLDITVQPVASGAPAYHVVVENRGARGLVAFDYKGYRGDREAFSGRRKAMRQQILLQPGGRTSFDVTVSPPPSTTGTEGPQAPQPLDRLVVSAVLWDDGTVEGDATLADSEWALADAGCRQIARVLGLLRAALDATSAPTPADLRIQVGALPIAVSAVDAAAEQARLANAHVPPVFTALTRPEDTARAEAAAVGRTRNTLASGMQMVKDAALADIDQFARGASGGDPVAFRQWLAQVIAQYETWLARAARWTPSPR